MFNLKWGIILGSIGFVLSLLVGIISGASFPLVLIRPLIFTAVFFVLGLGLWLLINHFLPELLFSDPEGVSERDFAGENPGSRVNISLGDDELPDMYRNMDNDQEVGDIGDLMSGKFTPPKPTDRDSAYDSDELGIDEIPENVYNNSRNNQLSDDYQNHIPDFADSGVMNNNDGVSGDFTQRQEPERKPIGNKPMALKGDYDYKELAAGIRTILSGDK